MKNIRYLLLKEICAIHRDQILVYGGIFGIRDYNILKSAVSEPKATFDHKDLYQTIFDKAAIIALVIIKGHPFIDGNKRVGIVSALIFLQINGYKLKTEPENLYQLTMRIATTKVELKEIANKLKQSICR